MSMSDPIADLLTRIRNALRAGFPTVEAPASRLKEEVCRVLKSEGYIKDYERIEGDPQDVLRIALKYSGERTPVITGIRRISKPSIRVYTSKRERRFVRSGLGISIVTTSRGVMTDRQARKENVGGEVLCEVW